MRSAVVIITVCSLIGLSVNVTLNLITHGDYGRRIKDFNRNVNKRFGVGPVEYKDSDDELL